MNRPKRLSFSISLCSTIEKSFIEFLSASALNNSCRSQDEISVPGGGRARITRRGALEDFPSNGVFG
jgi:hypothetical protein